MAEQGVTTTLPRLRFPEFRKMASWPIVPLEEIAERIFTKNSDGQLTRVLTNSAEFGVLDQRDYFDKDIATAGKVDGYYVVSKGDYVYNPRTSAIAPVGPISRNNLGEGVMSPLYTVFCFSEEKTDFYEHYFKSPGWHSYLRSAASTGARHDRMSITAGAFMRMPVPSPSREEQQKIADCLTSLEEVIAAQGRKVEALKVHKRGLMQQLFPLEGEALPRLRFPEFRDAPEWAERPLCQVIEVASGQVDPTEAPYCDFPHVGGENIESETGSLVGLKSAREDGVTSGKYLFDEKDVLYSKIRPILNKVAVPDFNGICSADIYPIRPSSSDITRQFLVYLLRSASFVEYATKHSERGKIPKINREALAAYGARLPQQVEQQRIADCLFSVDTAITAESAQLTVLKTHKQGLMQQLFPAQRAG
ncbi:restriction endonuclease subunit S [Xanthomonas cissicola]|uniref:Type I site-specific deoxyribonuclease n=1 Tax=Xanthomonas cissicola TaxID=86186 RepID=A0ABX3LY57_9XANT|nr:restriction endonuclease subunit S [Xanthomonas cissicola]KAB0537085.1 restriction endonuclease subunit S [Xanthomonas cissicola]OOW58542.1 type I site-specific deoxyribonuclease [Xanthomonas cissicola]